LISDKEFLKKVHRNINFVNKSEKDNIKKYRTYIPVLQALSNEN